MYGMKPELPDDELIRGPVREFMMAEAQRGESEAGATPVDIEIVALVRAFADWKRKEDVEILSRLMHHGGYEVVSGARGDPARPFVIRSYPVREAAWRGLQEQGVAVPVVYRLQEEN